MGYLSFRNVDRFFALTLEVLGEVIDHAPVEILVHVAEAVPLLRQHEHVESLSGPDQGVHYTCGVARMDIVVDVSMDEKKMALEVLRDFRIGADLIYEGRVSLLAYGLLYAMVGLAPPSVVDRVAVVSCA